MHNLTDGLDRIKERLVVLAADFEIQGAFLQELFGSDSVIADELALQFHDDFVFLLPHIENLPQYAPLCAALSALNRRLEAMSGAEGAALWSLEGLKTAPAWAEVRLLARECMAKLP